VQLEDGHYPCYWEFSAEGYRKVRYAAGIDGFQALQFALTMIGVHIWCMRNDKGYKVEFYGSEELGFP